MTIQTQPLASPRTASTNRLRRLAAVTALPALLALGACSSEAPVTADPTRVQPTTPAATGTSTPVTSDTSTSATSSPSATASAAAKPTNIPIKVTLKDPVLGHTITATQVVRNMAWPKGHPVAAESFEIVGVYVTFSAGDRYSAELSPEFVTMQLGPTYVRPTTEFGKDYAKFVPTAKSGKTSSGWLIYKMDRDFHPLILMMHRPAYKVSTTNKSIESQVFRATLTK